ncbi:MAG TPA: hypothetical protein VLM38_16980 [Blastocatellia bacterium]|nr:hypothetical protein [Blastocatellia bacterium]
MTYDRIEVVFGKTSRPLIGLDDKRFTLGFDVAHFTTSSGQIVW